MACASGYGERVTTRRMRRRVRGRFYWRVCKGVLHTGNVRKNKIKLWREDSREAWTIIGGWAVSGEHCRLKCDGFETAVDVKWISQRLPADNNYGILLQQTKKQQKQLKHSNHSRTIGSSVKPTAKRVGGVVRLWCSATRKCRRQRNGSWGCRLCRAVANTDSI